MHLSTQQGTNFPQLLTHFPCWPLRAGTRQCVSFCVQTSTASALPAQTNSIMSDALELKCASPRLAYKPHRERTRSYRCEQDLWNIQLSVLFTQLFTQERAATTDASKCSKWDATGRTCRRWATVTLRDSSANCRLQSPQVSRLRPVGCGTTMSWFPQCVSHLIFNLQVS